MKITDVITRALHEPVVEFWVTLHGKRHRVRLSVVPEEVTGDLELWHPRNAFAYIFREDPASMTSLRYTAQKQHLEPAILLELERLEKERAQGRLRVQIPVKFVSWPARCGSGGRRQMAPPRPGETLTTTSVEQRNSSIDGGIAL